jgi:hypothetical protein
MKNIPAIVTNKFNNWVATAPTTNLRILVTLLLVVGTAIRYWISGLFGAEGVELWEPTWEWLIFLATMSGIDALQHYGKRKTAWHPAGLNNINGDKPDGDERG